MECLTSWRSWIRPLVMIIYLILLIVALPLMIIEFHYHGTRKNTQAWFIGGLFVVMAIPISFWGILQHLVNYNHPSLQRYIIRILWMVPIYALNAWFALKFPRSAIYLDTLRECYEAYVIYNFMSYLLTYLNETVPNLELELEMSEQVKHLFPLCLFKPWKMGRPMINNCKHGVLQYTVLRPMTTVIAFICQMCGKYHEGDFNFKSAWIYLTFVNNLSQGWAMYCLVLFYTATKTQLKPLQPIAKFLCIKAVIFMSFWQHVVIAALAKANVIKAQKSLGLEKKDIANSLQDFLICIEMFIAAIAHYYSFSHKPYINEDQPQDCCRSFLSMWDVSDVRDDIVDHVRTVGTRVARPLRSKPSNTEITNERTPLLADDTTTIGSASDLGESCNIHSPDTSLNNYARFTDSTSIRSGDKSDKLIDIDDDKSNIQK